MNTVIRPVSQLSKNIGDVESICVTQDKVVHLTKNGANHLVIMSSQHYDNLLSKIDMLENLLMSESEIRRRQVIPAGVAVDALRNFLEERTHERKDQIQS